MDMVYHFSRTAKVFNNEPIPKFRIIKASNSIACWSNFNNYGKHVYQFNRYYNLDFKNLSCDCKYFVKFAYCIHILALKKLLEKKEFVNKPKKGRPKATGKW